VRLDTYIAQHHPGITRSRAKRLIEGGNVRVNGAVFIKAAHDIKASDRIEINIPPPTPLETAPENIPLKILYEDKDIIVVNKPAYMVVHPAAGNKCGTLVNALLHHCRDLSGIGGVERPGIVHRLDKGTSGIIVVAKNDNAHKNLSDQFKARSVKKRYCALVFGKVPNESGKILTPIGRHPTDRKKMSVKTRHGRIAETDYDVTKRYGNDLTLVDIKLRTGRTHQIRVHFSHMGHPLVGDDLYGGRAVKRLKASNACHFRESVNPMSPLDARFHGDDMSKKLYNLIKIFPRPFLHAYKLGFDHPRTGKRMEFSVEMPQDMTSLLKKLDAILRAKPEESPACD